MSISNHQVGEVTFRLLIGDDTSHYLLGSKNSVAAWGTLFSVKDGVANFGGLGRSESRLTGGGKGLPRELPFARRGVSGVVRFF
jgi:hypothetical protein